MYADHMLSRMLAKVRRIGGWASPDDDGAAAARSGHAATRQDLPVSMPIDHVVMRVPDPAAAVARYTALGFTVVPGGRHSDGITDSALVGFADGCHLELTAFSEPWATHRWAAQAARVGSGPIGFALLAPSVPALITRAGAGGIGYAPAVDAGRTRPDGMPLHWQISVPDTDELPFFCDDLTPRHLRVPDTAESRTHANGVSGIAALTVLVSDLGAALQRYRTLLGPDAIGTRQRAPGIAAQVAPVMLVRSRLLLIQPDAARDGADGAAGPLASLAPGLVGVTLRTDSAPSPRDAALRQSASSLGLRLVSAEGDASVGGHLALPAGR